MMGRVENEDSPGGWKLLLVPARDLSYLSKGIPQVAAVDRIGPCGTYEVVADVGPDRKIRMSRLIYEQVEVIG